MQISWSAPMTECCKAFDTFDILRQAAVYDRFFMLYASSFRQKKAGRNTEEIVWDLWYN